MPSSCNSTSSIDDSTTVAAISLSSLRHASSLSNVSLNSTDKQQGKHGGAMYRCSKDSEKRGSLFKMRRSNTHDSVLLCDITSSESSGPDTTSHGRIRNVLSKASTKSFNKITYVFSSGKSKDGASRSKGSLDMDTESLDFKSNPQTKQLLSSHTRSVSLRTSPTAGTTLSRRTRHSESDTLGKHGAEEFINHGNHESDYSGTGSGLVFPPAYIFSDPDDETNIIAMTRVSADGRTVPVIRRATTLKIIEQLTHPMRVDAQFLVQFLFTFRAYCTPSRLLVLLIVRYNTPDPVDGDPKLIERFFTRDRGVIRLRIVNLLRKWIEGFYYDFRNSSDLLTSLDDFIENILRPDMPKQADILTSSLSKQAEKDVRVSPNVYPRVGFDNLMQIRLLDLDVEEIARTITVVEWQMFSAIDISELVGGAWMGKRKETSAPNVLRMIHQFNRISGWVTYSIVSGDFIGDRVNRLIKFLEIIEACKKLNNFNAIFEITSGIERSSVMRLKHTWSALPPYFHMLFKSNTAIMSRELNFKAVRTLLHSAEPPLIPYLGLYLTDLTFMEEGAPYMVPGTNMINLIKCRNIAMVLREVHQHQQMAFSLEYNAALYNYLLSLPPLDEDQYYRFSLMAEGRGSVRSADTPTERARPNVTTLADRSFLSNYSFNFPDKWPFKESDSRANILFDAAPDTKGRPVLRGGTLAKLIEFMTKVSLSMDTFEDAFLFSFRSFSTTHEVLDLLKQRFDGVLPSNCDEEAMATFKKKYLTPVRLRVISIILKWAKDYRNDFKNSETLKASLEEFIDKLVTADMKKNAEELKEVILVKSRDSDCPGVSTPAVDISSAPKPKILDGASAIVCFTDINPLELARQLTLLDKKQLDTINPLAIFYSNITDEKFRTAIPLNGPQRPTNKQLNRMSRRLKTGESFSDVGDEKICVPIEWTELAARFDIIRRWVLTTIISCDDNRNRVQLLQRFIEVADHCFQLSNFNSMMALLIGLSNPICQSYKKAWSSVGRTSLETFRELSTLMEADSDDNMPVYLSSLAAVMNTPAIPYYKFHENKLNSLCQAPDMVDGENGVKLINMAKRCELYAIMRDVNRFKNQRYILHEVNIIQKFISNLSVLSDREINEAVAQCPESNKIVTGLKLGGIFKSRSWWRRPANTVSGIKERDFSDGSSRDDSLLEEDNQTINALELRRVLLNSLHEACVRGNLRELFMTTAKIDSFTDMVQSDQQSMSTVVDALYNNMVLVNDSDMLIVQKYLNSMTSEKDVVVKEWHHLDNECYVYGWPDNISVVIISPVHGENTNVNVVSVVRSSLDIDDVIIAHRATEFYISITGMIHGSAVALTHTTTPEALNLAKEIGVKVCFIS